MGDLLAGKVAIISGGSFGIGGATSSLFAEQGAKVVATARNKEKLDKKIAEIQAAGGEAFGIVADASSSKDTEMVFEKTLEKYGDIDILVNNVGMSDIFSIESISDEFWNRIIATNMNSTFYYCRAAVKYMLQKNKGSIVNVSSTHGVRPLCGVGYSATKHAVNSITQSVALRFNNTPIRCNAVCPGGTDTPLVETHLKSGDGDKFIFDVLGKHMDQTIPYSMPIEQAQVILFLASDLASAVNGAIVLADKGSAI